MFKNRNRFNHTVVIILIASISMLMISCQQKSAITNFKVGTYYIGNMAKMDMVVSIDDISGNRLQCHLYTIDSPIAIPQHFTVRIRSKNRWIVETEDGRKCTKINGEFVNDQIFCQVKGIDWIAVFSPYEPDHSDFQAQYQEPIYNTTIQKDVKYAEALGYWSSYPDEDKPFPQIYFARLGQLLQKKDIDLCMDIYEPDDISDQLRPLIIFIHGGSFYNGDKSDEPYQRWCSHFASLGYVAASINYRMGWSPSCTNIDAAGYRAAQDANAAIRYLTHNAYRYRINTDWVFVGGSSAGAITALNSAFLNDDNRPNSVADEGPISKLASDYPNPYHVAAIINMWGAVCDTAILQDSRTSIISFHGDADDIIPYGYGYPFKGLIEKTLFDGPNRWLSSFSSITLPIFLDVSAIWDNLISPMYGSCCIDSYYKAHGYRTELHTVHGGGHSLHVDEHRNIAPYFYYIQDNVSRFLYEEMVERPIHLERVSDFEYAIDNAEVAEVHWTAEGGVVLNSDDNSARMLFFADKPSHMAIVSGKYRNGIEFRDEINIDE